MDFSVKFVILTTIFILTFLSLFMRSDGFFIDKVDEPEKEVVKTWSSNSDENLYEKDDAHSKIFAPRNIPHRWRRDKVEMLETNIIEIEDETNDCVKGCRQAKKDSSSSSARFKRVKRDSEMNKGTTLLKKLNETDLNLIEFALSNMFFVP